MYKMPSLRAASSAAVGGAMPSLRATAERLMGPLLSCPPAHRPNQLEVHEYTKRRSCAPRQAQQWEARCRPCAPR
jgi:hypothetical protein